MKLTTLSIIGLLLSNLTFGQVILLDAEKETLKEICNQYNVSLKKSSLKNLKKSTSFSSKID